MDGHPAALAVGERQFRCFTTFDKVPWRRESIERPAGEVFLVARLLADQHQARADRSLPEHGLRGVPVEQAARRTSPRVSILMERPVGCLQL